ncbi:HAMP domain-containing protein [Paenibacillus macerans]|uniref:HAMP domain-containing protein n=1 Tax=Paenibacillus macerans TaxID=44252 RepID=A0A6N8F388_PAEMA|nr:histidine kinase [Paenibacillus macerans]MDU5948541.1 histidine kinase [Paenibacillus macerans]MED4957629.1 histidine kinase [Paenibacillus macerans]MUG25323.1 HAMP domain-containing protein [Paenibacillus macerans]UMV49348.1 sensor histidine kinase [Paenibacillus macerans]
MMIRSIYRNYFKNNLFMKIILVFSVITIVTIITFSYLMFKFMSESAVQRQLDIQKRAIESVSNYIGGKYNSVQAMVRDIYRDSELASNTSYFLEHPYQDYVRYRLDRFYTENSSLTDTVIYFRNQVEDNPDIRSLMLYSADQQHLYAFGNDKQFKIIPTNAARSYVPDVMYQQDSANVAAANIWVRKAAGLPDTPMYSVRVPINNNQSLRNIGQLVVYFDTDKIWNSMAFYKQELKGSILVISANGDVLFDSSGTYYGRKYPYNEQLNSIYDSGVLGGKTIVTKLTQSQGGFTVLSAVPKQELADTYVGLRNTILTISIICIFFAIMIPSLFISNFAKRMYGIIRFTRKVRGGDLAARIADPREDELGQISRSFNEMLDELNQYIERVYKAEIKQQQTELVALQARINPHFLYNTLEVIRMRAISQGARDVGEMIYSLSVLFKSLVQQKKIYTLKDELEACRLYLELFRIRYKDRFNYKIVAAPALYGISVMKLWLQPIIENYIVHGIRTDRGDNCLTVRVQEEGDMLTAVVQDNGKGIDPGRLAEIRAALESQEEPGEMFGLRSVHSRLRFLYGPAYGIEIESRPEEGTTIVVRYPNREGADAEDV